MYPTLIVVMLDQRRSIIERSIHAKHEWQSPARDPTGHARVHDPANSHAPEGCEDGRSFPDHRWVDVSFGPAFELRNVDVAAKEDDGGSDQVTIDVTDIVQKRIRTPSSGSATFTADSDHGAVAL